MQIPTLVRPLIFLIDIYLHVICLLHSVNLTQWRFLITSRHTTRYWRSVRIFAISHGRPPTCSAFDNGECHVTAFRPISEAAHSRSYDKLKWHAAIRCRAERFISDARRPCSTPPHEVYGGSSQHRQQCSCTISHAADVGRARVMSLSLCTDEL